VHEAWKPEGETNGEDDEGGPKVEGEWRTWHGAHRPDEP
jgi:hypothetical protein